MKKNLLPFLCAPLLALSISSSAFAFKGEITFTEEEKAAHLLSLPSALASASKCLADDLARHTKFITRYQISAFYGDQSSFARKKIIGPDGVETILDTTTEERRNSLRALGYEPLYVDAFVPLKTCNSLKDCPNMLQPTSCIGITLKCLGKGFNDAGQGETWKKVDAFTVQNGVTGDALLNALQSLGWKIVYWDPDLSMNKQWDLEEREKHPGDPRHAWGYHEESYLNVSKRNHYLYNTVDDSTSMVNFGTGTPELIKKVPFFVGIAHLGYHVFSGSYGMITEGHSTRALKDPLTVETSPFAPLAEGGGPHGGPYRSGIVAIPPGYLTSSTTASPL